jgi:hypothetical protein
MHRSTLHRFTAAILLVAFPSLLVAQPSSSGGSSLPDDNWPRKFRSGDTTVTLYQPQIDSWKHNELSARAVVAVQAKGAKASTFGVAWMTGETFVDKGTRLVDIWNPQFTKVNFPSAAGDNEKNLALVRAAIVPTKPVSIALDCLEADLSITGEKHEQTSHPVKNDPPQIVFSTVPALLILVDGDPAWRDVQGTSFQRVLNTRPLILKDAEGRLYLHLYDGWMTSTALPGPWSVASNPPSSLKSATEALKAQNAPVDLLEGAAPAATGPPPASLTAETAGSAGTAARPQKPTIEKGPVPQIIIATTPTELLVTEGTPDYVPITGTNLLYVKNTTGHIFKDLNDQKTYVVISGRWYRTADPKTGPWEFVPGKSLPSDFSHIPDDSPVENVKASVPGTPQAQEALIANEIPQTAKISRTAKITGPQYDGTPQLKPIEGTPLEYVVNSSTPVIRVDAKSWYACQNGVWFVATADTGPWVVADTVPAVIYSIPVSSPLHYVTYVDVYKSDPTYVYVSSTPGYYGTVVSDGVVVYGTGYYYPPWIGAFWFGAAVTFGFAFACSWTLWGGWAFAAGFGWGMAWGCHPWWGPMGWGYGWGGYAYGMHGGYAAWGPGGWAYRSGAVYQRWGSVASVSRYSGGFNAWTGNRWEGRTGAAYNSRTGNLAVGQRGAVGNVYTGNYAYGQRGVVTNTRTGVTAAGREGTVGNVYGGQVSGGKGVVYNPNTGRGTSVAGVRGEGGGAVKVGNSYFSDRDGNVYRRSNDGGWQSFGGSGNWRSVDDRSRSGDLDRSWGSRNLGSQRWGGFRAGGGRFGGFRR